MEFVTASRWAVGWRGLPAQSLKHRHNGESGLGSTDNISYPCVKGDCRAKHMVSYLCTGALCNDKMHIGNDVIATSRARTVPPDPLDSR